MELLFKFLFHHCIILIFKGEEKPNLDTVFVYLMDLVQEVSEDFPELLLFKNNIKILNLDQHANQSLLLATRRTHLLIRKCHKQVFCYILQFGELLLNIWYPPHQADKSQALLMNLFPVFALQLFYKLAVICANDETIPIHRYLSILVIFQLNQFPCFKLDHRLQSFPGRLPKRPTAKKRHKLSLVLVLDDHHSFLGRVVINIIGLVEVAVFVVTVFYNLDRVKPFHYTFQVIQL